MSSTGNTRDWKPVFWTALALAVVLGATGLRGDFTLSGDSPLGKLLIYCDCVCEHDSCGDAVDPCADTNDDPTGDTHGTGDKDKIQIDTVFDKQDIKSTVKADVVLSQPSVAAAPPAAAGATGARSVSLLERLFPRAAAAISPRMYVLLDDQIVVFDVAANRLLPSIPIPRQVGQTSFGSMAISPDGRFLYATVNHRSPPYGMIIADTVANRVVDEIPLPGFPNGVVLTQDGATAYVQNFTSATGGSILVIDILARKLVTSIAIDGFLPVQPGFSLALSPDQTTLYMTGQSTAGGRDFTALLAIDLATNTVATRVPWPLSSPLLDSPIVSVAHPNGTKLYAAGGRSILVLDTLTNDWIGQIPIPNPKGLLNPRMRISSDGRRLYVSSNYELSLYKISTATDRITGRISLEKGNRDPNAQGVWDFVLLR